MPESIKGAFAKGSGKAMYKGVYKGNANGVANDLNLVSYRACGWCGSDQHRKWQCPHAGNECDFCGTKGSLFYNNNEQNI